MKTNSATDPLEAGVKVLVSTWANAELESSDKRSELIANLSSGIESKAFRNYLDSLVRVSILQEQISRAGGEE